ncbi:hypothetical protein H0H87_012428 [Tephrocybe sp. NHM501043]|nr:hypothetical protein H0H87_012428 [Tephrocybe sp. NHM501043]
MTTSNLPSTGLGLDFLSSGRSDGLDQTLQDSDALLQREMSTSTLSNSTPLHLIVDSPSKSRTISLSDSRITLHDISLPNAQASLRPPSTLVRHGTLLSANAPPGRNAAELNSILGDSTARLKPGASVLPAPGQSEEETSLEQAKSRARVEVDIVLESNTCVQGGYLQGQVRINIQECTRDETPILISEGKVRVIGFESISNERDRYPFYQCSSLLSTVTATSSGLHDSYRDSEGFAQAIEGEHTLPFSMYLPMSANYGVPKGSIKVQAGVAVRYIAMVSIKVKDPVSNGRSIAHFYRDCEIWPRLNPSIILAPASIPLRAKSSDTRMAGSRRVHLTASVHRLHWIAGQRCFVKLFVGNESKKSIKSLTLSLIRTTVVFKPYHRAVDIEGGAPRNLDSDACTTSTTRKQVAEAALELSRRGTRGHASAKGWWAGVAPGEQLEFSHSIMIPPDALSVIRSRLIEVDYSIRVTLNTGGTLRTKDVQVFMPIQIINSLSIDPPPSYPLPEALSSFSPRILDYLNDLSLGDDHLEQHPTSQMHVTETLSSYGTTSVLEPLPDTETERLSSQEQSLSSATGLCNELSPEDAYDGIDESDEEDIPDFVAHEMYLNHNEDLNDLTIYEDDADEVIPHIPQADPEYQNAPRFSDLYYASVRENLCLSSGSYSREVPQNLVDFRSSQYQADLVRRVQEYALLRSGLRSNLRTSANCNMLKTSSSFQDRVQAKLTAAARGAPHLQTQLNNNHPPPDSANDITRFHESPAEHVEHLQDPTRSHRKSLPAQPYHHRAALAMKLSASESMSSLPYTKSYGSLNRGDSGSRLLPKPPVLVHTHSVVNLVSMEQAPRISCIAGSDVPTPRNSSQQLAPDLDYTSMGSLQHQLVHTPVSNSNMDWPLDTCTSVVARPSLTTIKKQARGSLVGSTNSVKERIKELEERQRLLDFNGP